MQLDSPYLGSGFQWLRGNLHTHTTVSDGEKPPEQTIADYEALGYHFLAISDHDSLVDPADYQSRTAMTLLPADEVSANGSHIGAVGITAVVDPSPNRQKVLDETAEMGGFTILNHPSWQRQFSHFTNAQMLELTGYAGIEIYNGIVERQHGAAMATDRWDWLLGQGKRVWGFANDDKHFEIDMERGWNVAQAADRSPAAIIDALVHGRFYASTGVQIDSIELQGRLLRIVAPNAQRIRFIGAAGIECRYVNGAHAEYEITGEEGCCVRAECFGAGAAMAWCQPVWITP
ncbi:MAG: PHP domain-containing protein [Armatimonadetes bacterium]|nr:PHP domain-containing protein [Armatimonadota bacterium]MDE2205633.1 PHP domain-containing protein [Armatimonadota bacterium]